MTAWLAAAGSKNRVNDSPALPVTLGAKVLFDLVTAAELAREEWNENQALCPYCQVATLCSLVSAVLIIPETTQALRKLFQQD